MVKNHWVDLRTGKPFTPDLEQFGFVYIITNLKTEKKYIGCKQYLIGKSKRQSRWQSYMGSSKYLKEDIKKLGKKHFKFEVIDEFKNKRSLKYYELVYQVQHNVLTSCVEGSDNHKYYNNYIGGKFYRPIESYKPHTEETKKKMSEKQKGDKHHFYGMKHTEETKNKMRKPKQLSRRKEVKDVSKGSNVQHSTS